MGHGHLLSRPRFWGYEDGEIIKFIRCPIGYCREQPADYRPCSSNREGVLCGECKSHHLLNIFSSKCIPKAECRENVILPFALLLPILIVSIFILKSELIERLEKTWMAFKSVFKNNEKKEKKLENTSPDEKSFIAKVKLLTFFYQLQVMVDVQNPTYGPVWKHAQTK